MVKDKFINVEIVYALPDEQTLIVVQIPEGVDLAYAVKASGILHKYPQIDLNKSKFGIFGKRCSSKTILSEGDRIEIYRELRVDPKERRRKKAE